MRAKIGFKKEEEEEEEEAEAEHEQASIENAQHEER